MNIVTTVHTISIYLTPVACVLSHVSVVPCVCIRSYTKQDLLNTESVEDSFICTFVPVKIPYLNEKASPFELVECDAVPCAM